MTAITTCDHCAGEPGRTIVDRRSRATMVAQLRAANQLASGIAALLCVRPIAIQAHGSAAGDLVLQLSLTPQAFSHLLHDLIEYQAVRPGPDDLVVAGADDADEAPA